MLAVISPAKSLDFSKQAAPSFSTQPQFLNEAETLVQVLKKYSPKRLGTLMKINPKLSQLNFERYQQWDASRNEALGKHALLSFRGDVFLGIDSKSMTEEDLLFAQDHLRILSGLYGLIRPLDQIQAYRLEMGSSLKFRRYKNLYQFWGSKIGARVREEAEKSGNTVINLASKEYFKAVEDQLAGIRVITPTFKDFKNGEYKFIHVFGKKARGLMTRFIIDKRIEDPEALKLFDYEGYFYNDRMSKGDELVFTRG